MSEKTRLSSKLRENSKLQPRTPAPNHDFEMLLHFMANQVVLYSRQVFHELARIVEPICDAMQWQFVQIFSTPPPDVSAEEETIRRFILPKTIRVPSAKSRKSLPQRLHFRTAPGVPWRDASSRMPPGWHFHPLRSVCSSLPAPFPPIPFLRAG